MLTQQQQEILNDSLWVVNTVLKRQKLQHDEDLRQTAFLYLCECIMRFDPSKGVKWTTYAFTNINLYVKRISKKHRKNRQGLILLSEVGETVAEAENTQETDLNDDSRHLIAQILDSCTPVEKKVLRLKLLGYKNYEICEKLRMGQGRINDCVQSIRTKAREIREG